MMKTSRLDVNLAEWMEAVTMDEKAGRMDGGWQNGWRLAQWMKTLAQWMTAGGVDGG